MNPLIKAVRDGLVMYEPTEADRKLLKRIKLTSGMADDALEVAMHQMCIMQAVNMMLRPPEERPTAQEIRRYKELREKYGPYTSTSRAEAEEYYPLANKLQPPSDRAICVSETIRNAMINLNDSEISDRQRAQLKGLVEDILNTCPVKRTVKEYKTKPTMVTEEPTSTREYMAAERERLNMLTGITDRPFTQALKLVREAAALYKVTEPVDELAV